MPDREKVIKGLQDAEISLRGFANHFPPLREECHKQADACHDALALLKEQEAVEPKKIKGFNQPCYVHYDFVCKNCNTDLIYKQPYCAGCGKPVKWE